MARTGNFGRAPRTAPSLTSTIIAIAREYQAQRDQNIMSAWEKGGIFEGKKVTDSLVLKHWKERMNGVSPDDPLYDTYKNAVTQLDYTIHESKMTAKYAMKKATDAQMVAFYLGWAKKVPKDSEFYRTLQRDAGQYMRTVKTSNAAEIARLKEERYQKQQAATDREYGAAAQFLTDTMRRLNQSGYADGHISPTLDAPGAGNRNDITDFDPANPEVSMQLMALIAPQQAAPTASASGYIFDQGTGDYIANPDVLYNSDTVDPKTGNFKPVTGQDILNELTKYDPQYKPGQPVDVAYLTSLLERENIGLQEQIDRATKTGHMQDAENLQKRKSYVATITRQVAAWPIEKAYLDLRETYDIVAKDPSASPMAVDKARTAYERGLQGLVGDTRIAQDDNMRARIQAEIDGKTDIPTLYESFTGNGSGGESKDAAYNKGLIDQNRAQIDAVSRDAIKLDTDPTKAVWTYGTTDSQGFFHPDPNGVEIGASTVADVTSSGLMPQTVTVDDPRGGKGMQMMVTAVPVMGVAKDPRTGEAIPPLNNQPIAYAYNFPKGATNDVQFGYMVKDPSDPTKSVMMFSNAENPPWADGLKPTASSSGGNHYEVDFTSYLPMQAATSGAPGGVELGVNMGTPGEVPINVPNNRGLNPDGTPRTDAVTGFNVVDVGKPTKSNPNPTGSLTWDPYSVARSSDIGRNALGGIDPTTDFTSLTVSNLMTNPDGQAIMKTLDQRDEFKTQVFNDGMKYAGATRLPDGGWDPTTADTAKLAQAEQQQNIMKNASSFVDFIKQAGQSWQRLTTGSPYPANTTPQPGSNILTQGSTNPVQKLATDLVKGTPFEPLAQRFMDGTLTKKPASLDKGERDLMVNVGKVIKVPGYEGKTIKTTTTTPNPVGIIGGSTNPVGPTQQPVTSVNPYTGFTTNGPTAL